jgi:methyl-accepting chemotaxis protein
LKDLNQAYGAEVEDAVLRMNSGELTAAEGIVMIKDARDSIESCWRQFKHTAMLPEEQILVLTTDSNMHAADLEIESTLQFVEAMQEQGHGMLANELNMLQGSLLPTTRPVIMQLDRLARLELSLAHEEYQSAAIRFTRNLIFSLLILAVFLLLAIVLGSQTVKQVNSQLENILGVLARLGQGDLSAQLTVKTRDELGTIARGTNEMIFSLRTMVSHVAYGSATLASTSHELSQISDEVTNHSKTSIRQAMITAVDAKESSNGLRKVTTEFQEFATNLTTLYQVLSRATTQVETLSISPNIPFEASQQLLLIRQSLTDSQSSLRSVVRLGHQMSREIQEGAQGLAVIAQEATQTRAAAIQTARGMAHVKRRANELNKVSEQLSEVMEKFNVIGKRQA